MIIDECPYCGNDELSDITTLSDEQNVYICNNCDKIIKEKECVKIIKDSKEIEHSKAPKKRLFERFRRIDKNDRKSS